MNVVRNTKPHCVCVSDCARLKIPNVVFMCIICKWLKFLAYAEHIFSSRYSTTAAHAFDPPNGVRERGKVKDENGNDREKKGSQHIYCGINCSTTE